MNHAAAETALVDQLEVHTHIVGEGLFASSDHDGADEQLLFVDQPGLDCMRGQLGTSHADVTSSTAFSSPRTNPGEAERPMAPLTITIDRHCGRPVSGVP